MKKLYFFITALCLAIIAVGFNIGVLQNQQAEDFQANISIEDILRKAENDLSQPAPGTIKANQQAAANKQAAPVEEPQEKPTESNVNFDLNQAIQDGGNNLPTEKELQDAAAEKTLQDTQNGFASEFLPRGPENPTDLIYNIIDVIFIAAGIFGVIFMIIASIQAIANFGEEEAVSKAKKMFTYTASGLIIIILAYAAVTNLIRYLFLAQ